MGVKIINILKDDTFEDILGLFRQAPAGEVILVLPRVSKLFKKEDHFAAFASEAQQGSKIVSVLTANPDTATLARKFGFTVMQAGNGKPAKPSKSKKTQKAAPVEAIAPTVTLPPPADEDTPSDDDITPLSDTDNDVVLPSDEVLATATLAKADEGLDYIETMWRNKVGANGRGYAKLIPHAPSKLSHTTQFLRSTAFSKKIAVGVLVGALLLLGGVVYAIAGSAHIAIVPTGTPLDTQITVKASDQFTAIDATFGSIPGQLIEVSKTAENTVPATGSRDVASKARGKITVLNEYSTTSQTLVATTRFTSTDGHVFRTLQTVTVPGNGSITVNVIADKPGAEYNIEGGKFIVAAFQEQGDKERVAKLYGTSEQAMSGGASGPSKVITQADYDSAKAAATQAVKDQVATALSSLESLSALQTEPSSINITDTARPDDAGDQITVTATGGLKTIAFRKADLFELIKKTMLAKERQTVIPESLAIAYSDVVFKDDTGVLSFTVSLKGTGYATQDTATIARDISGKNGQQIRDYFSGREGVQSANVKLSPFWVRTAPKQLDHISIDIVYNSETPATR